MFRGNTAIAICGISAVAALAFCVELMVWAREILNSGANLSPIYVMLEREDGARIDDTPPVFIKTRFSEMPLSLIEGGNVWSVPNDQIRAVALVVVRECADAYKLRARLSFQRYCGAEEFLRQSEPVDLDLVHDELQLRTDSKGKSFVLSLLGRRAINWRGDLSFFFLAMLRPLSHVGLLWLIVVICFWFRSEMSKQKPECGVPTRETGVDHRIAGLDELRGIAILMVVTFHFLYASFQRGALGWAGLFPDLDHSATFLLLSPLTFGFGGVGLFFAISGFCIHLSYAKTKSQGWAAFFRRRFFRIYPPYLFALLMFAFFFPSTRYTLSDVSGIKQFYSELFLCFNLDATTRWPVNGSFWSVAVEMQLYILFPLIYWLARRVGWRSVLMLCFACETAPIWCHHLFEAQLPFWVANGPFRYVFSWTIGAKLADDRLSGRPLFLSRVPLNVWLVLLFTSLVFKPLSEFSFMLFSIVGVSVVSRLIDGGFLWLTESAASRYLRRLGVISYSVYLFHQPILNAAASAVAKLSESWREEMGVLACLAVCPLILWVSSLSYAYLESPSIAAGKWYNSRIRKLPAACT